MTPYDLAMRFVGTKETSGVASNPLVLAMLTLDQAWPKDDAVPWCSAFMNFIAWMWRLPRSKSLAARSWLLVGTPVELVRYAPLGDPVEIKVRGYHLTLRKHEAQQIWVRQT